MKNFALKSWWIMNFISFILIIISSVQTIHEEKALPIAFIVGIILFLTSQILIIRVSTFIKKEDDVDEAWKEYRTKNEELDKLVEFLKIKAFRSTIVTKEEIYKHMEWEDDESRN